MDRVLVAGAGGGIGSALVDALAVRADVRRIYALHRHPVSSTCDKVRWLEADLTEPASVGAAIAQVEDAGLDMIVVTSGLLHDPGLSPEKSLAGLDPEALQRSYAVNAVAPLVLLSACRPLLKQAAQPVVCMLSAKVGSIGDNRLGGWYGYRMAKAALNMAVKTAAVELSRDRNAATIVAVHPGTTRTALSNRFVERRQQAVSTPQESAERLITLLERLNPEHTGAFLNYDGVPLPW
ncbi:MAG TPA: SDR family NAD(P)-dependent oxidoreductase [Pseudomonadales bacterium]